MLWSPGCTGDENKWMSRRRQRVADLDRTCFHCVHFHLAGKLAEWPPSME